MVTRAPPAFCGIAEYSSMLISSLLDLYQVDATFIATKLDGQEGVYTEPYSKVKVVKCFDENGPYGGILDCINKLNPGKDTVVHFQHDYSIYKNTNEFLELLSKLRRKYSEMRIVLTLHTVARYEASPSRVSFQKSLAKLVDMIIVHSPLMEYELIHQGVNPIVIRRIAHGTLLNKMLGRDKKRLLARLGIVDCSVSEKPVITTPGFIRPNKGLVTLLKSFKEAKKRVDLALILAGAHQSKTAYLRDIEKLAGVDSSVFIFERYLRRDEILALLSIADLTVFPYIVEPFVSVSGALHLSIGSRRASVCTKVAKLYECNSILPELSVPSSTMYVEISRKIISLVEDQALRRYLEERVWKYALETRWENIAGMHLALYEEISRI